MAFHATKGESGWLFSDTLESFETEILLHDKTMPHLMSFISLPLAFFL